MKGLRREGARLCRVTTQGGVALGAYSMDLRPRVLADSDAGLTIRPVAAKYGVSRRWVRWLKQRGGETGHIAPGQSPGRPCEIDRRTRRTWTPASWAAARAHKGCGAGPPGRSPTCGTGPNPSRTASRPLMPPATSATAATQQGLFEPALAREYERATLCDGAAATGGNPKPLTRRDERRPAAQALAAVGFNGRASQRDNQGIGCRSGSLALAGASDAGPHAVGGATG
jgi:hypothetical protein